MFAQISVHFLLCLNILLDCLILKCIVRSQSSVVLQKYECYHKASVEHFEVRYRNCFTVHFLVLMCITVLILFIYFKCL